MDKRFLNKVLGQIVRETTIDYDEGRIYTPIYPSPYFSHYSSYDQSPSSTLSFSRLLFSKHCREVYGLNKREIEYVWKEYKDIIIDKIENNGL
jgi:hypothetical protein